MKAILEFTLPDDEEEFKVCQQGLQWKSVVGELAEWLRHQRKHGKLSVDELNVYDKVWDRLWDNIKDEDLKLW